MKVQIVINVSLSLHTFSIACLSHMIFVYVKHSRFQLGSIRISCPLPPTHYISNVPILCVFQMFLLAISSHLLRKCPMLETSITSTHPAQEKREMSEWPTHLNDTRKCVTSVCVQCTLMAVNGCYLQKREFNTIARIEPITRTIRIILS